jgi:hypothetical protein
VRKAWCVLAAQVCVYAPAGLYAARVVQLKTRDRGGIDRVSSAEV